MSNRTAIANLDGRRPSVFEPEEDSLPLAFQGSNPLIRVSTLTETSTRYAVLAGSFASESARSGI